MCNISLKRTHLYDNNINYSDIKTQLATVRKELKNKFNNNSDFVNCEITNECFLGNVGICTHYKYYFFASIYIFQIYKRPIKPYYVVRRKCIRL